MTVKDRLIEIKQYYGWKSNVELAKAFGVGKQSVNHWMNREKKPGRDAMITIRRNLGINDEWVLGRSDQMFIRATSIQDKQLLDIFIQLEKHPDPKMKALFLKLAQVLLDN